jgi:putative FmdB family regulatory protein
MPIYEYFCPQCKNEFELRLSFNANCTPLCPKCYSEAKLLISSFACKTGSNLQAPEEPFVKTAWDDQKPKAASISTQTKTQQGQKIKKVKEDKKKLR